MHAASSLPMAAGYRRFSSFALRAFWILLVALPVSAAVWQFCTIFIFEGRDLMPGQSNAPGFLEWLSSLPIVIINAAVGYGVWRLLRFFHSYVAVEFSRVPLKTPAFKVLRNLVTVLFALSVMTPIVWFFVVMVGFMIPMAMETFRVFVSYMMRLEFTLTLLTYAISLFVMVIVWRLLLTLLVLAESAEVKHSHASHDHN